MGIVNNLYIALPNYPVAPKIKHFFKSIYYNLLNLFIIMKVQDKIAQILVENNIKDIFMVTGGAAMHLNDSLQETQT